MYLRSTSPISLGSLVLVVSFIAASLVLLNVVMSPYAGFSVKPDDDGRLIVISIDDHIAATGLTPGTEVVALISRAEGNRLQLQPGFFYRSREERTTYFDSLSDAWAAKEQVYQQITEDSVTVETADGRLVVVQLDQTRHLTDLSWDFWLRFACAISAWLLGATLWVWQPAIRVNQLMMCTGLGLMLTWAPTAIVHGQLEMLFKPVWLSELLVTLQCLGIALFATSFTCLSLYFPTRLSLAAPTALGISATVGAYTLFLLIDGNFSLRPGDFFTISPVLIMTVVVAGLIQWRTNMQHPRERAQQLWFIFSATIGPTFWFLFYWLPVTYGLQPYMPISVAPLTILLSFTLAVLGIWTHPSFRFVAHIETIYRWWITSLIFLTIDVLLISLTAVTAQEALVATIAVILWVYLPARQWLYNRINASQRDHRRHITNQAVLNLAESSYSDADPKEAWSSALTGLFDPVTYRHSDGVSKTELRENGRILAVEPTAYSPGILLDSAERGRRLFNDSDASVVILLSEVFEKLFQQRDAFQAGRIEERQRISRDLHDQIGSKLLSMLYAADDSRTRELVRETMDQLGELLRALKTEPVPLMTLEAELKRLSEETCNNYQLELDWSRSLSDSTVSILSNHYLSIMNIVRELLNNTVRHSGATLVAISLQQEGEEIRLRYQENGSGFQLNNITPGNGLRNIEDRALEMQARLTWDTENGLAVLVQIPVRPNTVIRETEPNLIRVAAS